MEISVKQLRDNGFKVRVCHLRKVGKKYTSRREYENHPEKFFVKWGDKIASQGGKTVVTLTTPDDVTITTTSKCKAPDNYNKRRGVQICLGRAFKELSGLINENLN